MPEHAIAITERQSAHVAALLTTYQQAEHAMRTAVELLVAGHVTGDFHTFRLEPNALVVLVTEPASSDAEPHSGMER